MHENWNAKNVFEKNKNKKRRKIDLMEPNYWGIKTVKNKIWLINWHEKNENI